MNESRFLRLRVDLGSGTQLGPGKAQLLQSIAEAGSIAAAGRAMHMSYKRAWYLVDTLNGYFREPLVISTKGGKAGGGARLTEMGERVLAAYRRMEVTAEHAVAEDLATLRELATK
jgi:molybdate transport system regulatory protein